MKLLHTLFLYVIFSSSCAIIIICLYLLLNSKYEIPVKVYILEEDDFAIKSFKPNTKLFNVSLEYLLNSKSCESDNTSDTLALIMVTSYFGNVETRSAMRRAFPSDKLRELGLKRVFLLGTAPQDKYTTQEAIVNEGKRFGDLIQGNFQEAYRNLTYKHVMGLRYY